MERIKLWIIALWLYIWYRPFHVIKIQREIDEYGKVDDWWEESRWYVRPRELSWLLLFPIVLVPIFIYGGFKMIVDYFKFIFTIYERSVELPEKVSFTTKLDIVKVLH